MIIRKTKTTKPPVAAAMVVFIATWAANIPHATDRAGFPLLKVSNGCGFQFLYRGSGRVNLTKG